MWDDWLWFHIQEFHDSFIIIIGLMEIELEEMEHGKVLNLGNIA